MYKYYYITKNDGMKLQNTAPRNVKHVFLGYRPYCYFVSSSSFNNIQLLFLLAHFLILQKEYFKYINE